MLPYNNQVRERCLSFTCGDTDLDDFFHNDAERYAAELMQFIKDWFRHEDNKTGCRFLVVDAYNNPRTLHFYERNDFRFLHTDEVEERAYYDIPSEKTIATRLMYFDLKKA